MNPTTFFSLQSLQVVHNYSQVTFAVHLFEYYKSTVLKALVVCDFFGWLPSVNTLVLIAEFGFDSTPVDSAKNSFCRQRVAYIYLCVHTDTRRKRSIDFGGMYSRNSTSRFRTVL